MAKDKTSSSAASRALQRSRRHRRSSLPPNFGSGPKLDEGYDSPSLLVSAFLSYALDKIVYHTRRVFSPSSTPLESSIIDHVLFPDLSVAKDYVVFFNTQ